MAAAVPVIEAGSAVAARLADAAMGWLTTVGSSGQPQSSYVWFHFGGTDLLIFSQPGAGKVRNIRGNPLVSFHLDGDGHGGAVVTIDARAQVLAADRDPARLTSYLAKYDEAIRTGLATTPEELSRQFSTAIVVTPTRLRSW
jgi:PPOX class probable F420-dependent enzyme